MSHKQAYSYAVLRYAHDITTGEFVNVGVALFSSGARTLSALCRTTSERPKHVFPSLDTQAFRTLMQRVAARFAALSEQVRGELQFDDCNTVLEWAHQVVAPDDSSLRWSPMGHGLSNDLSATLEQLFERFVRQHDRHQAQARRDDEKVWRNFSGALQQRNVLKHFAPQTFSVQDDEIHFDHAWKNGKWHCLAPVSFDLASPESIRDKAHKILGQLVSVGEAQHDLKLYYLVGQPSEPNLQQAFRSALSILGKSDVPIEVYEENQAALLSEKLAAQVEKHESST